MTICRICAGFRQPCPMRRDVKFTLGSLIMNNTKSILVIAASLMAQLSNAQMPPDLVPASKQSKEEMIGVINTVSAEVAIAARDNVAHDATLMSIRIFAKANQPKAPFNLDGYRVEVIYNPNIAGIRAGVGSYRLHHNAKVLIFAAAKYAAGQKEFGLSLIKLLAEAEPDLYWDSPYPVMKIDEIQRRLIKDDGSLKTFLNEMNDKWQQIVKKYGS